MSEYENLQTVLDNAITAARTGDTATARRLLKRVLEDNPDNELALMWMASSVNSPAERRAYLQQVVRINPNNQRARDALAQLSTSRGSQVESVALQVERDQAAGRSPRQADDEDGGGLLSRLSIFEIGLIVALAFALGLGFLAFTSVQDQQEVIARFTLTPSPTVPTNTPRPTDPVDVVVTSAPQILPPTFTPTATPTDTATPTPTYTPFPLGEFEAMLLERAPLDTAGTLYRVDGSAQNAELLDTNIKDVVYDLSGSKVALVKEVSYAPDEQYDFATTVTEIFVGPADNPAAAEQVTFTRIASAYSPSFSPEANQLVYASDFDGDDEIWLLDLQSTIVTKLTDNEVQDRDPSWSPDGTRIIFASDRELGSFELYLLEFVIQQDGAQLTANDSPNIITRLTVDQGNSFQPRWSHDGQWIAYINDSNGDGDVLIIDKDGLRRQVLTLDDGNAEDKNPSFTPDMRFVSFVSNREEDRFQVYLATLNGREIRRLTQTENIAETIDYRPMLIFRLITQN